LWLYWLEKLQRGAKTLTQAEKGKAFHALHERERAFIIPNPWDIGSARLLAHLGFEALATTSAGYAYSVGLRDNTVPRDEMMVHVAAIATATELPVSVDLGNGFGESPETVAETIRLVAAAGAVGGSIEDMKGPAERSLYDLEFAAERMRAAVEAARALPFNFTLTARAENYLVNSPDLKETIARLQAYEEAGANVLFAPGLKSKEDIRAVVSSVGRPVNVLAGLPGMNLTLDELSELGVKRISVGSGLSRAAYAAVLRAAHEMQTHGSFTFTDEAAGSSDPNVIWRGQ
jgi:2-methylisocitrate lyase-like PEP mutase family enzyme